MFDIESIIINNIIHDVKISTSTINEFMKYVNMIQMLDCIEFDQHCMIISELSETEFKKYINFLNVYSKKKGV